MLINFFDLTFEISDNKIFLKSLGDIECGKSGIFAEIQVAGENKISHMGLKQVQSSEGPRLVYAGHSIDGNVLTIEQKTSLVSVVTTFTYTEGAKAFSVQNEITNISGEEIVLEEVSAFTFGGLAKCTDTDGMYLTRFLQSHHTECQPRRESFAELGFFSNDRQPEQQKRISGVNIGSWSTKEALPQGIIEDTKRGIVLMFQIESGTAWYYEISDENDALYLYLTGPSTSHCGWCKALKTNESYKTPRVSLSVSDTVDGAIAEMTKYRRTIAGPTDIDKSLPTIFNEYMHLSWDTPFEARTREIAPIVAKLGAEYYVIDCGWHNEEDTKNIYYYVGQWKESKKRFPAGMRATTDFIRSLGMKAGLWIEPEVVGIECREMLDYYDDDCFLKRHGKRIATFNRYFLDYRSPKVIDYMSEVIRRMVEDYGADYIKFDYNQDVGIGADYGASSCADGLQDSTDAFFAWVDTMTKRYPSVIFEGCASGGMRMDYGSLSHFSLISTSDQVDYLKYPYIAGNVLCAVIPEQAAVWSYPVGTCTKEEINDDQIIMNMINSFLGRMHLASHLELMNENQLSLVKDGIDYYNSISEMKHTALPIFPMGFARFGDGKIAAGLKDGKKILLAFWCLGSDTEIAVDLGEEIKSARVAYPFTPNSTVMANGKNLTVRFERAKTAAFIEIEL